MVSNKTPEAEYTINEALVHQLLKKQHPDLADLPIIVLDEGWDNQMFRIGKSYLMRLPRREMASPLIANEQHWLPKIADQLPLPISRPVRFGTSGFGYPCSWSILPWIEGTSADLCGPTIDHVEAFVAFLQALHVPAPQNAPLNPYRGVPLKTRAKSAEARMEKLQAHYPDLIAPLTKIWKTALNCPIDMDDTWIHGDLHAKNVLMHQGKISGVIDWGDITSGDRATDLAAIWMLFSDKDVRQKAIDLFGTSMTENTWLRAKGWAILFGCLLLYTGINDHPRHKAMGEKTLIRIIVGP